MKRYVIKERFTFEAQGGSDVANAQIANNNSEFRGFSIKVRTLLSIASAILGFIIGFNLTRIFLS